MTDESRITRLETQIDKLRDELVAAKRLIWSICALVVGFALKTDPQVVAALIKPLIGG